MPKDYLYLHNPYELLAPYYDQLFLNSPFYCNTSLKEEETFSKYVRAAGDGEKALDIGCGTGDDSLQLALLGYVTTGIDISPKMLEIARKKASDNNVKVIFRKLDAKDLIRLNETYNLAVAYGSFLNHIDNVEKFLSDLSSVLRKGGKFLFSFDNIMGIDIFIMLIRDLMKRQTRARAVKSLMDILNCVFKKIRRKNFWPIRTSKGHYYIKLSYWSTGYILDNLKKNNFEIEDIKSTNTISCFVPSILMSSVDVESNIKSPRLVRIVCELDRKVGRFLKRSGSNIIIVCKKI